MASNPERWQSLVNQFGLKKPGTIPWNPNMLDDASIGASHGEKCVIRFLLNLWNPEIDWRCGKFDLIDAYSVWDDPRRRAFLSWANDPWWPS